MNEFARPGLAEEKLPPVSTADNDKVLTVDGGVWKAKTPSGGGGTGGGGLLVNVTYDDTTETYTCDKTAGEIMAVFEAAGSVVFKTENDGDYMYAPLERASITSSGYQFSDGVRNYTADSANDYPTMGGVQ